MKSGSMSLKKYLVGSLSVALILAFSFLSTGCEEPDDANSSSNGSASTLGQSSVGDGTEGYISDYFYNFSSTVNAEFYRITQSDFNLEYSDYLKLYAEEPKLLTLHTFPEFLIEIHPDEVEYTDRSKIDSLTDNEVVILDSVTLYSEIYRDLETMEWDLTAEPDFQRYSSSSGDQFELDTTMYFADTVMSIAYSAVIDTPLIDYGLLFVDIDEWVDTTYEYETAAPKVFATTFNLKQWKLSPDSLMFRVNCDCNDNGVWDTAETTYPDSVAGASYDTRAEVWYQDTGNGIYDPAEPWYDIDDDGLYSLDEPFQDRNCNDVWDDAEEISDSSNPLATFDSTTGQWFIDAGNGQYDDDEYSTDLDRDGVKEPDELFYLSDVPNNLLVDYAVPGNPTVLLKVEQDDSLVTRWGITYRGIIMEYDLNDYQETSASLLDSTVTLYTNQVLGHVTGNSADDEYFITKTEWINSNTNMREYDYLMFKQTDYVYQLVRPSYFKPYGYYWTATQLANNFWYQNFVKNEILYYTPNGQLRDGERVTEEYYDTTAVAIYKIEKSFTVDADTVVAPAKHVRGQVVNDAVQCYADTNWAAAAIEDCPGVDTTFTDCFRITREMTMTMIGTGVEYGERNITYLARDHGIVRDEVYIRWTELEGSQENWIGLSRWELGQLDTSPNPSSKALNRIMDQARSIRLQEFDQVPEFDHEPIHWKRTIGFQRAQSTEN